MPSDGRSRSPARSAAEQVAVWVGNQELSLAAISDAHSGRTAQKVCQPMRDEMKDAARAAVKETMGDVKTKVDGFEQRSTAMELATAIANAPEAVAALAAHQRARHAKS